MPAAFVHGPKSSIIATTARKLVLGVALACGASQTPASAATELSRDDEGVIATLVAHDLQAPAAPRLQKKWSLSVLLDERYKREVKTAVAGTYVGWRLVSNEHRYIRDSCFFDRLTSRPALGIGIGYPKLVTDGVVEVEAGSAICVQGSSEHVYRLANEGGSWRIVMRTLKWIV